MWCELNFQNKASIQELDIWYFACINVNWKQIKRRAESEQIVQHENTSDRHWDLTFYLILRRGEGDKRGKNLWLSEMLRTLPSSGKKWENVSSCGGAAQCSMGYIHWSKPFCCARIWLSLAERLQNIHSLRGCTKITWPANNTWYGLEMSCLVMQSGGYTIIQFWKKLCCFKEVYNP